MMLKRFWWLIIVMLPLGIMVGVLVASVVSYVTPRQYQSEAVIEIGPLAGEDRSSQEDAVSGKSGEGGASPDYLRQAVVKIRSPEVFGKVVESLELAGKRGMGRDAAVHALEGKVEAKISRASSLVVIRVRDVRKEDARNIASEVVRVYKELRDEADQRLWNEEMASLKKAVDAQSLQLNELKNHLAAVPNYSQAGAGLSSQPSISDMGGANEREAKRDMDSTKVFLEDLKLKQSQLEMRKGLRESSVVVHEEPQIASSPIFPNVGLNLVFGAAGGASLAVPVGLLLMAALNQLFPVGRVAEKG